MGLGLAGSSRDQGRAGRDSKEDTEVLHCAGVGGWWLIERVAEEGWKDV